MLYSEPSVREYVRERVQVELLDTSETVEAYCYNLPREPGLAGANPAYAIKLSQLVDALQFEREFGDAEPHFGVLDADGAPKPALEALRELSRSTQAPAGRPVPVPAAPGSPPTPR